MPDVVSVELPSAGLRIDRWKSYAYNSDYLTPTDGWTFTLGDDETGDELLHALDVGIRLTLVVNGVRQGDGYIDDITIGTSRGGTEVTISGRDLLGPVVDACLDPTTKFTAGQTLEDILRTVFGAYGFTKFAISNDANRAVLTGETRGVKLSKVHVSKVRHKVSGGAPLKSFVLHQLKPHANEGAFAFAARIAQRHGLWISLAADNETIVVAKPDFDQVPHPLSRITHRRTGSNVIHGSVKRSAADQPSCIIATGRGGGGEHDHSAMRVIAINGAVRADVEEIKRRYGSGSALTGYQKEEIGRGAPFLVKATKLTVAQGRAAMLPTTSPLTDPYIRPIITRYPGARVIVVGEKTATRYLVPMARPIFVQDQESGTIEQLENFARRELALRQRKAFEVHYTLEGHAPPDGPPWTVDTMITVDDDVQDVHENLYVLGRTFHKSRSGGTMTDLHLVRPHTLEF